MTEEEKKGLVNLKSAIEKVRDGQLENIEKAELEEISKLLLQLQKSDMDIDVSHMNLVAVAERGVDLGDFSSVRRLIKDRAAEEQLKDLTVEDIVLFEMTVRCIFGVDYGFQADQAFNNFFEALVRSKSGNGFSATYYSELRIDALEQICNRLDVESNDLRSAVGWEGYDKFRLHAKNLDGLRQKHNEFKSERDRLSSKNANLKAENIQLDTERQPVQNTLNAQIALLVEIAQTYYNGGYIYQKETLKPHSKKSRNFKNFEEIFGEYFEVSNDKVTLKEKYGDIDANETLSGILTNLEKSRESKSFFNTSFQCALMSNVVAELVNAKTQKTGLSVTLGDLRAKESLPFQVKWSDEGKKTNALSQKVEKRNSNIEKNEESIKENREEINKIKQTISNEFPQAVNSCAVEVQKSYRIEVQARAEIEQERLRLKEKEEKLQKEAKAQEKLKQLKEKSLLSFSNDSSIGAQETFNTKEIDDILKTLPTVKKRGSIDLNDRKAILTDLIEHIKDKDIDYVLKLRNGIAQNEDCQGLVKPEVISFQFALLPDGRSIQRSESWANFDKAIAGRICAIWQGQVEKPSKAEFDLVFGQNPFLKDYKRQIRDKLKSQQLISTKLEKQDSLPGKSKKKDFTYGSQEIDDAISDYSRVECQHIQLNTFRKTILSGLASKVNADNVMEILALRNDIVFLRPNLYKPTGVLSFAASDKTILDQDKKSVDCSESWAKFEKAVAVALKDNINQFKGKGSLPSKDIYEKLFVENPFLNKYRGKGKVFDEPFESQLFPGESSNSSGSIGRPAQSQPSSSSLTSSSPGSKVSSNASLQPIGSQPPQVFLPVPFPSPLSTEPPRPVSQEELQKAQSEVEEMLKHLFS